MAFDYIPIERVEKLTKKEFIDNYYKPQKPVVITNQIEDWPAFTKWDFNFIREVAGDKMVPLYDSRKTDYTKKVNEPDFTMTMSEYIDILEKGPTDLRIFLYNLMKEVPVMKSDMQWPRLGLRLLKNLPLVFLAVRMQKYSCIMILIFLIFFMYILKVKSNVFWSILKKQNTCIACLIPGCAMRTLILITLILNDFRHFEK